MRAVAYEMMSNWNNQSHSIFSQCTLPAKKGEEIKQGFFFFQILYFVKGDFSWSFFFSKFSFLKKKKNSIVYCLQFYIHLGPESPLDER